MSDKKKTTESERMASRRFADKQRAKGLVRKTWWLMPAQIRAIESFLAAEKRKAAIEAAKQLLAEEEARQKG